MTWPNNDQPYPSLRLYYVKRLPTGTGQYPVTLFEIPFENGWSAPRAVKTYSQTDGSFSDSVGAVAWRDGNTRYIRVFVYFDQVAGYFEKIEGGEWSRYSPVVWDAQLDGAKGTTGFYRPTLAAVQWNDTTTGRNQIRVFTTYAPKGGSPLGAKAHMWSQDGITQRPWGETDLSESEAWPKDPQAQVSATVYRKTGDAQATVRFYRYGGNGQIIESVLAPPSLLSPAGQFGEIK